MYDRPHADRMRYNDLLNNRYILRLSCCMSELEFGFPPFTHLEGIVERGF